MVGRYCAQFTPRQQIFDSYSDWKQRAKFENFQPDSRCSIHLRGTYCQKGRRHRVFGLWSVFKVTFSRSTWSIPFTEPPIRGSLVVCNKAIDAKIRGRTLQQKLKNWKIHSRVWGLRWYSLNWGCQIMVIIKICDPKSKPFHWRIIYRFICNLYILDVFEGLRFEMV